MQKNVIVCDLCNKEVKRGSSFLHLTEVPQSIAGDGSMLAVYTYPQIPKRSLDFCSMHCLSLFATTHVSTPARAG
jgi:hypothetical protein